eukprot:TRINITY_DN9896_c0_g1_i1.p1 TRINITY_DN9896_c0_g1~~TRINITY_DN9896_c0_g1_i1.p1  ORF type:complete len:254 (-),score=40.29 TRINITY_DN9896_c0_g1_i1:69-830(-)
MLEGAVAGGVPMSPAQLDLGEATLRIGGFKGVGGPPSPYEPAYLIASALPSVALGRAVVGARDETGRDKVPRALLTCLKEHGMPQHRAKQADRATATAIREPLEAPAATSQAPGGLQALSCEVPEIVRQAERGNLEAVKGLLARGVDPDTEDQFGLTGLHCASKKGHEGVIAVLLEHGARADRGSRLRGETPLHYACKYGHTAIAKKLIAGRADVLARTTDKKVALDYACKTSLSQIEAILACAEPSADRDAA